MTIFTWNHETQICFLWETQKYVEILNNIWIITFYIEIFAIFGNFWAKFCLIHSSSCWFFDHFFAWNHGTQKCVLWETQKYVEVSDNIWIITFYKRILVIFGNFCLVHSSQLLSGRIFAWNHGREIFSFRITQKKYASFKIWWKYLQKTTKIAKFEVNLGYPGNFWTNWVLNK